METMERGEEMRPPRVWCTVCSGSSRTKPPVAHAAESNKEKRCGSCGLLLLKNLKLHDEVKADAGSTKEEKVLSPKPKPAGVELKEMAGSMEDEKVAPMMGSTKEKKVLSPKSKPAELKEMAGSMEVAPMMEKMDIQAKTAAMLEEEKKRKATGSSRGRKKKKTKMVVQRVGAYYLDLLMNYCPTPVEKPSVFTDPVMEELQAYLYDRYKANLEFRDNVVAQYKLKGYAEALMEVTDDEEDDEEEEEEEEEDDDDDEEEEEEEEEEEDDDDDDDDDDEEEEEE